MARTGVLEVVLPEVASEIADKPGAWELTLELLQHMDTERVRQKREIRTGEILASLLLL